MVKRLVVYSISDKGIRTNFEAAIHEIDPESKILIESRCILFRSDTNLIDLAAIIPRLGCDTTDEIYFFEITGQASGFGDAIHWLSGFMNA